ncbi:MAG: hypothetical protein V4498_03375 [candidate division FCPU426 bacterium]
MLPIFIVTHGGLADALLSVSQGILGPQPRFEALGLRPDMGAADLAAALSQKLDASGGRALILVDILGGTPWNVAVSLGVGPGREVLSGVSLPLVVEALASREPGDDAPSLAARLREKAAGSVVQASEMMKGRPGR